MKAKSIRLAALLALFGLVSLMMACQFTTQRVVQQGFQADDDTALFLYDETPSNDQGLLKCSVNEDGDLHDCRDIELVFNYDN